MKTSKIAIGSWAFSFGPYEKNPWTFEQVCQYAGEHGYDGIEINGFRPHPHPEDYDTDEKCGQLKAMIESYGLGISGFAADFRDVPPALVSEAEFLKEVKKCLEFCRRMGIDILRVDTITAPDAVAPELYDQHFKNLTDNWRAAAELCRAYDVLMVWEFEPGFWLNKPSEVKLAVDTVNHPNFKLLFDSSHAYMCSVVGARHNGEKEILKGYKWCNAILIGPGISVHTETRNVTKSILTKIEEGKPLVLDDDALNIIYETIDLIKGVKARGVRLSPKEFTSAKFIKSKRS